LELLRAAAEGKCGIGLDAASSNEKISKGDRKEREKRKKALVSVDDILSRHDESGKESSAAVTQLYDTMADALEERAKLRDLWGRREKDHVFHDMPPNCRPMIVPFQFDQPASDGGSIPSTRSEFGLSPFSDSPAQLKDIGKQLRQLCKAFQEGDPATLPPSWNHSKTMDWVGWEKLEFALELQEPWAGAVVDGKKKIETRQYNLPPALIGKRVLIMQSCSGQAGISTLGNNVDFRKDLENESQIKLIGWCVFTGVKVYKTREAFDADETLHLVKPDGGYGWKNGTTQTVYGWVVGEHCRLSDRDDSPLVYSSGTRRLRSLFELRKRQDQNIVVPTTNNSDTADTKNDNQTTDNLSRKRNKKGNSKKNNKNQKRRRF
jgi:hypothetical protein